MEQTIAALLDDGWEVQLARYDERDAMTGEPFVLFQCRVLQQRSGHEWVVTAPSAGEALHGAAEEVRAFGRWPHLFPTPGAHPPADDRA